MKIIGILIILVSGVGVASAILKEEERILSVTRAWLDFLMSVRSAVDNYSMSAREILRNCGEETFSALGYPQGIGPPQSLYELAVEADIPDKECGDAIRALFKDFGKSYRGEQVSRCDDCIERISARESAISGALPTRKKMVLSVSLCVTLVILILLM